MIDHKNRRRFARIGFSQPVTVNLIAIDGSWSLDCEMLDVSQHGARLLIPPGGMRSQWGRFFLVLSSTGSAKRICSVAWAHQDEIGVRFEVEQAPSKSRVRSAVF